QRRSRGDRCTPPFFRALDALAVDDRGGWACFSSGLLSTFHVKSMVDTIQRAVVVPKREVAIHRAARGQILRDRAPLAARAQHVHQAVDHVADAHRSLATPALRRWNDRCDESPFLVCQVAGIAKLAAVISTAVLVRPHRRYPANRADAIESQVIPTIQDVFGRTLSKYRRFLLFVLVIGMSGSARGQEIWLSPNAPVAAVGTPGVPDLLEMFHADAPWPRAASIVSVFVLSTQYLLHVSEENLALVVESPSEIIARFDRAFSP